jgi:ArsR family transcriptional regulator, arsenate/arsenite/antimonite-responsive transcriptional repressor
MRDPAMLFRALADETRLRMLYLIRQHQELCVCDLENVLGIGQSKASRHLRYLLNAGLLQDRREAVWIYYRIAANLKPAQTAILESIDHLLDPSKLQDLNSKLADWREHKKCGVTRDKLTVEVAKSETVA